MSFDFNNPTAEEKQLYFEQLCQLDEAVLRELFENSDFYAKLKKLSERYEKARWVPFRDTIKCSKCGFGFFPNSAWFQDGQCVENHNFDFRPNYCPNCGVKMQGE